MDQEKLKEMTVQYQQLQQQIQNIMIQKENAKLQVLEIDNALFELKTFKGEVYKTSGVLMLKTTPEDAKKELDDKKMTLETRIKSLEKRESSVREELQHIQVELNTYMKSTGMI